MSLARLVVTAVRIEGRTKAEVSRDYGVSVRWVYELCRQADITHRRLADETEVEIMDVIDDHSRFLVAWDARGVFKAADVVATLWPDRGPIATSQPGPRP